MKGFQAAGRWARGVVAAAACVAASTAPASAQAAGQGGVEVLGVRAQGMGGAFVAVADDASAVYWNPAGLATGDFFSILLERSHVGLPAAPGGGSPALRTGAVLAGAPPLGVGYYRLGSTHHVPVTLVQSIGEWVNVGAALKAVLGDGIDGGTHARFDADLGVIVRHERWRAGLVVRNLTAPRFGPGPEATALGGDRYRLPRHARAGVALFPRSGLTLAVDADLTRLETVEGERRAVAAGVEQTLAPRLVLRGGVRVQTVGAARPAASAGGSVGLTSLVWLDVQGTGGGDRGDRAWSAGLRVRF